MYQQVCVGERPAAVCGPSASQTAMLWISRRPSRRVQRERINPLVSEDSLREVAWFICGAVFCRDESNIPAAAYSKPQEEAWVILEIPKEMDRMEI